MKKTVLILCLLIGILGAFAKKRNVLDILKNRKEKKAHIVDIKNVDWKRKNDYVYQIEKLEYTESVPVWRRKEKDTIGKPSKVYNYIVDTNASHNPAFFARAFSHKDNTVTLDRYEIVTKSLFLEDSVCYHYIVARFYSKENKFIFFEYNGPAHIEAKFFVHTSFISFIFGMIVYIVIVIREYDIARAKRMSEYFYVTKSPS
ncbi:MAG: hypothetical protein NTW62_00990 [Candidatus Nomurabacteria bacterium]|nr:hypothetical protein [Candidatus Nomurabacteria bacterium]